MTGAQDEDVEGFVNEMLAIRTVEIAVLIREHVPGRARVSLRSRGNVDVAEIAREFGGGGHRNAAGCSFDGGPDEATSILLPRLRQCLGSC
jgi:phosphoesterase RecJ-like protein